MEPSITKFLDYLKYEKRSSEHTITAYEGDLAQFEKYLHDNFKGTKILKAEPLMVRAWMKSGTTTSIRLGLLTSICGLKCTTSAKMP